MACRACLAQRARYIQLQRSEAGQVGHVSSWRHLQSSAGAACSAMYTCWTRRQMVDMLPQALYCCKIVGAHLGCWEL